jgi:hypothetical protein
MDPSSGFWIKIENQFSIHRPHLVYWITELRLREFLQTIQKISTTLYACS